MYVGRGKNRIKPDYGIKDFYRYYKNNADNPLPYKTFVSIWKEAAKAIMRLVIYRNHDFSVPARLGSFGIRKLKVKIQVSEDGTVNKNNLAVDYKASWKKWMEQYPGKTAKEIAKIPGKKPVYHLNKHTDGYRFKFIWDKFTCNVKNQSLYSLKITRTNKQELVKAVKKFKTDYYEYERY